MPHEYGDIRSIRPARTSSGARVRCGRSQSDSRHTVTTPLVFNLEARWQTLQPEDIAGHHCLFSEADCVVDSRNQRYDDWSGYPSMIEATLTALEGTVSRYIYVDNLYLYGSPAASVPIDETVPRRPISIKGMIRHEIEARLLKVMPMRSVTIARFPDFYHISTDTLPKTLRWFGPPAQPHQFIHIPDAAKAIRLLIENEDSAGHIWHVVGDNPVTGYQLLEIARAATGGATRLRVISPVMVRLLGLGFAPARGLVETLYLWTSPVILDATKFRQRFGHQFIHAHQDVLRELVGGK